MRVFCRQVADRRREPVRISGPHQHATGVLPVAWLTDPIVRQAWQDEDNAPLRHYSACIGLMSPRLTPGGIETHPFGPYRAIGSCR